jgi:hypothetical protein
MHGQAHESFHKVKLRQNVVFILPETALEIKSQKCVWVWIVYKPSPPLPRHPLTMYDPWYDLHLISYLRT